MRETFFFIKSAFDTLKSFSCSVKFSFQAGQASRFTALGLDATALYGQALFCLLLWNI